MYIIIMQNGELLKRNSKVILWIYEKQGIQRCTRKQKQSNNGVPDTRKLPPANPHNFLSILNTNLPHNRLLTIFRSPLLTISQSFCLILPITESSFSFSPIPQSDPSTLLGPFFPSLYFFLLYTWIEL